MSKLKENAKLILVILLVAAIGLASMYAIFSVKRWFNFEVGYKPMAVETSIDTVCSMIKPEKFEEILVNPEQCSKHIK